MPESQIKVEYNHHCGDDLTVVNAARRSFGKKSDWEFCGGEVCLDKCDDLDGSKGTCPKLKDKDKRLIEFLARGMTAGDFETVVYELGGEGDHDRFAKMLWEWRNTPTHDTPFNHCFISFDVKAPIFVTRQLVKHEYLILSEFSRRYVTDEIEFYYPGVWRDKADNMKQGSADTANRYWNHGKGTGYLERLYEQMDDLYYLYQDMMDDGVCPEQARMVLPQSLMTEFTWSGTLGAFAKMCRLRLASDSQYETRLVAEQVRDYLYKYYPVSAPALVEGVK